MNGLKKLKKRGLPNIRSTIDAHQTVLNKKSISLFSKYKVLSKDELHSRYEIYIEQYAKQINIEANAAIDMVKTLYIPAVITYTSELAETISSLKGIKAKSYVQEQQLEKITISLEAAYKKLERLEIETAKAYSNEKLIKQAQAYRDNVLTLMTSLREDIDTLETLIPKDLWPVPSYADLLFSL